MNLHENRECLRVLLRLIERCDNLHDSAEKADIAEDLLGAWRQLWRCDEQGQPYRPWLGGEEARLTAAEKVAEHMRKHCPRSLTHNIKVVPTCFEHLAHSEN